MDLNDVLVFVNVARLASLTRAAATLELPKSTVSERVTRLEKRLGVRLLERTTRSVRLTPLGADYFAKVEGLVRDLEQSEQDVANAHRASHGVLRVGSPHLFAKTFLVELVEEYLEHHPDIEVELVLGDQGFDMIEEKLDVAIHVTGRIDPNMVVRKLGMGERICVTSPKYVAARGFPKEPSNLTDHACLLAAPSRKATWTFRREGTTYDVAINARYAVMSIELVYRAVLRGLGIAVLPAFMCVPAIERGEIVRVLQDYSAGDNAIQIVYGSQRHLSARARAFADLVVERSVSILQDLPRYGRIAIGE